MMEEDYFELLRQENEPEESFEDEMQALLEMEEEQARIETASRHSDAAPIRRLTFSQENMMDGVVEVVDLDETDENNNAESNEEKENSNKNSSSKGGSRRKHRKTVLDEDSGILDNMEEEDVLDKSDQSAWGTIKENYCYKRVPVRGNYMSVTSDQGTRGYVTLESEVEMEKRMALHASQLNDLTKHMDLGDTSIEEMIKQLDEEELGERLDESNVELGPESTGISMGGFEDEEEEEEEEERLYRIQKQLLERKRKRKDAHAHTAPLSKEGDLWVDKYTPQRYLDLLSDETMNRDVLSWLKEWDLCVFGDAQAKRKNASNTLNNISSKSYGDKGKDESGSENNSGDKRPFHKAILLTGPPGLGKTTLAHVLARIAGYKPVEINASDDRSENSLMQQVQNAVEMQSMFTEKKPNCLIIDEIDGAMGGSAGQGAINALVKLIKGDKKEANAEEGSANKKKNKNVPKKLNRPIICICNDQYAPALRPLRKVVKIFSFSRPTTTSLSQRLMQICKWEHLSATTNALNALCEMMENDVRACLNVLQFVHSRGGSFSNTDLSNLALGHKDVIRDRITMWKKIFEVPKKSRGSRVVSDKRNQYLMHGTSAKMSDKQAKKKREKASFRRRTTEEEEVETRELLDAVYAHGEYAKLMEGIRENFVTVPYNDPTFSRTVTATQWLSETDLFLNDIESRQAYYLSPYIPYCILGIHLSCRVERVRRVTMPQTSYILRSVQSRKTHIAQTFMKPENCFGKAGLPVASLVCDVISPLLDILAPPLRAVNMQLMSKKEKEDFANLVSTLMSLKLNFVKDWKNPDPRFDSSVYALDPPINELSEFGSVHKALEDALPPWLKEQAALNSKFQASRGRGTKATLSARRTLSSRIQEMISAEVKKETHRRIAKANYKERKEEQTKQRRENAENAHWKKRKGDKDLDENEKSPVKKTALTSTLSSLLSPQKGGNITNDGSPSPATKVALAKTTFISEARRQKHKKRAVFDTKHTIPVHFKYYEGFTNAVRRKVTVSDFF